MTDFLNEEVIAMPPVSGDLLEDVGEQVLQVLAPEALKQPARLDVRHLIDHVLPEHGIQFYPASAEELGNREAATDPSGDGEITVLIGEDAWHALGEDGPRANRPRATAMHELSHAIFHVPVIRRRRKLRQDVLLMARQRRELKPYEDPEWQAWMLAGCILMPRSTLVMMNGASSVATAEQYGVSEAFLNSHMRRLKLI